MNCTDAQPLISRLLDGELPDADAAAVFAHLSGCTDCRRFMSDTVRIQAAVRSLAAAPLHHAGVQRPVPARLRPPTWVSYVAVASAAIALIVIGALGTLAVTRFERPADQETTTRVVWVLPEREITSSSIQVHWR
ncbi:MAG: zf-HC2 domain-containing protein [Bacteroidetes bacterium]|jgi:anti-sigma factor RsiW|nr:zf-HC2 domain-containing protein [Bacteroidota bacterium]